LECQGYFKTIYENILDSQPLRQQGVRTPGVKLQPKAANIIPC